MKFWEPGAPGTVSRGVFVSSGSAPVAELLGGAGFDWLILDMEHGLGDEAATLAQLAALGEGGAAPFVRLPALRTETVKRLLDFGAAGIVAPMVDTAGQAAELVRSLRYPPDGVRGLSAGCRAGGYGKAFSAYFDRAQRELCAVVQIETRAGVDNVDAIAAVPGVDVVFVGHSDLSLGLGCYGDFAHPEFVAAEQAVLAAARRHGKRAGMLLKTGMDPASAQAKGYTFLAMGTDLGMLRSACVPLLGASGMVDHPNR